MRRHVKPLLNDAGPNLPASGMDIWLDGQISGAFTVSGANITRWLDRSGNGRDGVATGTPQKIQAGGRTWASGFSTSSYFDCGTLPVPPTETTGFDIFAAYYMTGSGGTGVQPFAAILGSSFVGFVGGPDTSFPTTGVYGAALVPGGSAAHASSAAAAINVPGVMRGSLDAGAATVSSQKNRDAATTAAWTAAGRTTTGGVKIGYYFDSVNGAFGLTQAYLGEIIIYASAQTAAKRLQTMRYLIAKYQR